MGASGDAQHGRRSALVSLARALSKLPDDSELERALRDVLVLFRRHKGEWLSEAEVRVKTGQVPADVHRLLPVLVEGFVLDFDSTSDRFRYGGDVALSFEIDTFVRRVESHQSHVRTNVAKFRERYGA